MNFPRNLKAADVRPRTPLSRTDQRGLTSPGYGTWRQFTFNVWRSCLPTNAASPLRPILITQCVWLVLLGQTVFAADVTPPKVLRVDPAPGLVRDSLKQITVTFTEPVGGVDIDDLLINNLPVIGVSGADDTYTFKLLQPEYGSVKIKFGRDQSHR